ncbi:cytidine deaminase [Actinobacillus arthritidis]|uniref:cytidine deaminase n=1 Tax=Actinobacillus arthritidis TaxID=157339 RepID=UPI002442A5D5|nr:cytidine deaminase [Actinobacillus arthritidis]WGE89439.1 cytidine deaminase [Actinobacillus arthritidis]
MPTVFALKERITQVVQEKNNPVITDVASKLAEQQYRACFSAEQVKLWAQQFKLSPIELALECLPLAACYALVPISKFYVGAVAIGESGQFYFGANQEFTAQAIQQTVHAEQSAISHAWLAGETAITDMVVNYTPCGHCRQFMNELNSAKTLKIHLPHSQDNLLQQYLPDSFGPKDLNIEKVLFDPQQYDLPQQGDALTQARIQARRHSYAPYSESLSGIALQVGEQIICGRYAENAAFNPSFLPLQSALNYLRLSGKSGTEITRVVMAERKGTTSHRQISEALVEGFLGLKLEYVEV